jgi:sulfite exporter TauE/SafE
MLQGLILGFSNGAVCLANCAPFILPYMLGAGKTIRSNFADLLLFLAGRFSGYLCLGILAWFIRISLSNDPNLRSWFMGVSALILGLAIIIYNLQHNRRQCELQRNGSLLKNHFIRNLRCYPWIFGLITGINICPPFLAVFTEAIDSTDLGQSIFFLSTFFVGTSVFLIPFPFIGSLANNHRLKIIGELTLYLVAGYYIVKGAIGLWSVR